MGPSPRELQTLNRRITQLFSLDALGPRFHPIEGLRGLSAALVFLVHFQTLLGHFCHLPWLRNSLAVLSSAGNCGVDVFFAISGFLIYRQLLLHSFSYPRFLLRRAIRLYPAFLVLFAFYAMERSATGRLPSPAILLANFLMLPTMVPVEIMIVHAWSLSYELLFYLTLPLLIRCLRMSVWPGVFRSAFWSGLAALSLALTYLGRNPHPRFVAFLCGILLFEVVRPSARPKVLGNTLALIAFCGALSIRGFNSAQTTIFGHNVVRIHSSAIYSLLFLGTLLLGYFLLASQGFLQRALSWTPLRYFGNMSYSYYLVHGPVLFALNLALARLGFPQHLGAASFLFLSLASFALTLLPAAALFLLVEKPLSLAPRLPSPPGQ